ncbi:AAA family ATPase [Actinoplanes sp. LDG1-06]|uniref:AAA family ATPase n=1 Tax=Paractinoplanes ovalisporus TaxID=2810368 RepID=A0ABS2A2D8_9ACTN|nr:LuxR family transcriptional regulator [Actinoplanes ovalisporus]MBM2614005.1 AAA family ATPase [Actinoplanes ovalisporus]
MTVDLEQTPVGRGRECRVLDALLDAVTARGAALMLWGDPGVDKTTLLDYTAARAGGPVLRARGVESEAVLPYATLADLLVPLRRHFRDIPAVQREALEGCLALADNDAPNPYAVCAAALNVLAAAAETGPVVLLVDDLHWVDQSSQRVLLFIARRLGSERVALVLSARDDAELRGRCDVPALDVAGLSAADCALLLGRHGLTAGPHVAEMLAEHTGGNPLALLEWAGSLRPAQLAGDEPIAAEPVPGSPVEDAWLAGIGRLPERTRAALAVLGSSRPSAVALLESALAGLGLGLADLAPAEAAAIVLTDGASYEFRHPLLRSAVLRQTSLADRRAAYAALAAVSDGATRAWYRASGATGPDDEIAAELAAAAREARRRSGYDAASQAWHRAAELTAAPAARAELLYQAASDALLGGAAARCVAWCDEALAVVTEPLMRADVEQLRGRVRTWLGQTAAAHDDLVAAAAAVRPHDPGRACALLSEAALPAAMDGDVATSVRRGEESVALAAQEGLTTVRPLITHGQALIVAGRVAQGRAGLDRAAELIAAADPVADQQMVAMVGQSYGYCEQPALGRRMITLVVDAARRHSVPSVLPIALGARSEIDRWAGRWAAAEADATESLRWAEELGQTSAIGFSLACLSHLDALRGERARCEDRIARARRDIGPYGVGCLDTYFTQILGLSALAYGDYDGATAQLEQTLSLVRKQGLGNPRIIPFAADLVEAHVRAGRPELAAEPLEWLTTAAELTGMTWPAAALARCRGLLATGAEEAGRWFAEAGALHRRGEEPFEQARTLLCYGEAVRRFRRPAAARAALMAAHATFESLGAVPWTRRAAAELAAAGQRGLPDVVPSALALLSPQEVQVARAIARGMNNAEAAGALFVSRKTVEAHLTRVYRKLGVRSRTDLTRALVAAGLAD